jgi:calcineurin-like phosphoesterase family protein
MAIWYTADTHFGHENIINFCKRPFKSASHMDAALLENMWEVVKPEDELWIVGDFAFGEAAKNRTYLDQIFQQLPVASKHLIVGNHDGPPTLDLAWETISNLAEVSDGPLKQSNTLCHYPMITWNHARRGALQLFGHVHNNWRGSSNSVNVGVDVWDFKPIKFADIERRARSLAINKHWDDAETKRELI